MLAPPEAVPASDLLCVHARAQAGLADYCALRGISHARILETLGGDAPDGPPALWDHMSLRMHALVLEACSVEAADPAFALNWTRSLGPGPDDTVSLAARYAPDFTTALEVSARYLRIVVDAVETEMRCEGTRATLAYSFSRAMVCRDQFTDRSLSKTFARLMICAGPGVRLEHVDLARSRPGSGAAHETFFGAPVRFSAPRNALHFHVDPAGARNPLQDADLFAALCDLNRRRLDERKRVQDFVSAVNDAIGARIAEPALTAADIASDLAMSTRVLQRRLRERGLTFHALHDALRQRMASDFLRHTDLTVSQIAFRLGFSATGNFTRAARRWFGCPPSVWRGGRVLP